MKLFPKFSFFFLLISTFFELVAQPVFRWDRTIGGTEYDELHEIKPLYNGDILYGGATQSSISPDGDISQNPCFTDSLNFDFWLIKTDINGNKYWDKRYGGTGQDRMWTVIETSDGGFLLGGDSNSNAGCDPSNGKTHNSFGGLFDMWIIKTDKFGNKEWDVTFGSDGHDELQQLLELPDGSFFALGFSNSGTGGNFQDENYGNYDYKLLKISATGELIWDKSYGGIGAEKAYKIIKTIDGNYLLGGFSTSVPMSGIGNKMSEWYGGNDYWVVNIDIDGNILWEKTYGGAGEEVLLNIEKLDNGEFLLGGQSASDISGTKTQNSRGFRDFYLIKIDADGNQQWDRVYGGEQYDDGFAIHVNDEGEILFGGVSGSGVSGDKTVDSQGGNDFWLLFLEPNGDIIWQLSFGGTRNDALTSIFPVPDGGVILGGHSASNAGGDKSEDNVGDNEKNDIWIIKTECKLDLDLGADTIICEGDQVLLNGELSGCNYCRYRWDDGELSSVRSITPSVTRKYSLGVSSRSGCEIRDTILVEVNDAPDTFFANISPPRCPGENTGSIQVTNIDGGTPPFYYSFNGGVWNEFNYYFALKPEQYHLELTDANECYMDTVFNLPEPTAIDIFINGTDEIQLGDSTKLIPIFTGNVDSFRWVAHPALSCLDCLTPFARPTETTTFALNYYNNNGCEFSASATIAIRKDRRIFFPTAFSPNNDGDNDQYMFYLGPGVKKVSNFSIFGRWGELLYQRKNYQPGELLMGWNGYHRGKLMPPGAYVYFCEIEWVDGWKERLEGSFNLIR